MPKNGNAQMMINASQCRAGRALVEISREDLAERAGVGVRTISDFESGRRNATTDTVTALRRALERAGVEFIEENGGGPGVRLKRGSAKGSVRRI